MGKVNRRLIALMAIVVGILFITMKGKIVSVALTLLGIGMIVMGILGLLKQQDQMKETARLAVSILEISLGCLVITSGWMFVSLTLSVIAFGMLVFCLGNFVAVVANRTALNDSKRLVSGLIKPIIGIAASVCLLFNQGGMVSWIFVVVGVIFIVEGLLMFADSMKI